MPDSAARIVYPFAILIVCLIVWAWVVDHSLVPAYVLPAPTDVLDRLRSSFSLLAMHTATTAYEVFCGFLLAIFVGVTLAWLIAHSKIFKQAFYPWLIFIQVIPKVAIGPLLVVWIGVGFLPKVLVSFLLAFFPVLIDTLSGLRSVQRESTYLLQSMGSSPYKSFRYFHLPHALPHIFASLKVAITFAVVGAVVGEFIGADKGLGYVLIVSTGNLDTVLMFVALIWTSVMSLAFYGIIIVLEAIFLSWHPSQREEFVGLR
jgi:NitT/TauT family transport system permease protein